MYCANVVLCLEAYQTQLWILFQPVTLSWWQTLYLLCAELLSFECPCMCLCIIMHVWAFTSVSHAPLREKQSFASVWVWVRVCPSPAWGCVFFRPASWGLSATKARLRLSISFTLCWWESAERLIVFGVLGQHTQISLCASKCFPMCVSGARVS